MDNTLNPEKAYQATSAQREYNKQLQIYLREISALYPEMPTPLVNGIFDDDTSDSLKFFQKKYGLEPSGSATPDTWEALYENYNEAVKSRTPPAHFSVFPTNDINFQFGDYHPGIFSVQHAFITLSETYNGFDTPEMNGTIDEITAKNIREFRRIALLPDGSHIDVELWNRLALTHNSLSKK